MYRIGVDLGGTNIAVGLVDEDGKISLVTLKQLSVKQIVELIDFSISLKRGLSISYPSKKFATLFDEK